jgi:hypothetical protein
VGLSFGQKQRLCLVERGISSPILRGIPRAFAQAPHQLKIAINFNQTPGIAVNPDARFVQYISPSGLYRPLFFA